MKPMDYAVYKCIGTGGIVSVKYGEILQRICSANRINSNG